MTVPLTYFDACAFVCVDIQDTKKEYYTDKTMPGGWLKAGFTKEDANAAVDFHYNTALPNACRVADACRRQFSAGTLGRVVNIFRYKSYSLFVL